MGRFITILGEITTILSRKIAPRFDVRINSICFRIVTEKNRHEMHAKFGKPVKLEGILLSSIFIDLVSGAATI